MDQENSTLYYRRREQQSRELADRCSDPAVKLVHTNFADRYAEKLQALTPGPRLVVS